jgi:tellurite resistance protein
MHHFLMALPMFLLVASPASAEPLTASWIITKYSGLVFGILLILFVAIRKRRPSETQIAVPSHPETPMFNETLLTTMFHTAQLSDDISQNTLQALLRSYKNLTGRTVSQKMIGAKYAQRTETDKLLSIMAPFARIERDTMMKACIDVAAADGAITMKEHDFLMKLNTALELDDTWFRNQVSIALRPDTPQTISPRPMPVSA